MQNINIAPRTGQPSPQGRWRTHHPTFLSSHKLSDGLISGNIRRFRIKNPYWTHGETEAHQLKKIELLLS